MELGFDFKAMASPCEVRVVGDDELKLHEAARAAIAEVRRIETKYSRYDRASLVSHVNAAAGVGPATAVDDETTALIDFAARLHELSSGRFDITSGVLRRVWNFSQARVPAQAEIDAVLRLVGWPKARWREGRIELPLVGMEIDFGGFGKEYAADRAAGVLLQAGIAAGYVNLGGDIRVVGPRRDGSPWRFGLQHPRRPRERLDSVDLLQGALATSGDYERFFELDGRRYCHVLDARSGWPVDAWQSVSVVAPSCAGAGALCTLAMLFGPEGVGFLQAQAAQYIAVRADGRVQRNMPP